MKFVKFGGIPILDCPSAIILAGRRLMIDEGVGVHINTGSLTILELFQLPNEEFHRYRIRRIVPWDGQDLEFEYPSIESVPAEIWVKAEERVQIEKTPEEKARQDMPHHWSFHEDSAAA